MSDKNAGAGHAANGLAARVADLMRILAAGGASDLNESQTELMQTLILMDDAIIKLNSSFSAMVARFDELQRLAEDMLASGPDNQAKQDQILALRKSVERDFHAAMMTMQYHDMTGQLIHRVSDRLNGALETSRLLEARADDLGRAGEHSDLAQALSALAGDIKAIETARVAQAHKPVQQAELRSGDIDLF